MSLGFKAMRMHSYPSLAVKSLYRGFSSASPDMCKSRSCIPWSLKRLRHPLIRRNIPCLFFIPFPSQPQAGIFGRGQVFKDAGKHCDCPQGYHQGVSLAVLGVLEASRPFAVLCSARLQLGL